MMVFRRFTAGILVPALALACGVVMSGTALAQMVTPLVIANPTKPAAPKAGGSGGPVVAATFTQAQSNRGADTYTQNCVACHGPNLNDGEFGGPPLIGTEFDQKYFNQTADTLYGFMSAAMPPDRPGQLTPQAYADIEAYIMSRNGVQPGTTELPSNLTTLATLTLKQ